MLNLSIIIPVYNVEAYIEECLASVVAQSDAKANIECIIVDDCSPDGSMDIVRRFVDNYQGAIQFRLLRHTLNKINMIIYEHIPPYQSVPWVDRKNKIYQSAKSLFFR